MTEGSLIGAIPLFHAIIRGVAQFPRLNNLTLFLVIWIGVFLAFTWLALAFWAYRDCRRRSPSQAAPIVAGLVSLLFPFLGVLLYLLLRPPPLGEKSALPTAVPLLCPGCAAPIKEAWMVCPDCHTRLKKPCHECGRLMELTWQICPYCASPIPGMHIENLTLDEALAPLPVIEEESAPPGE